MTAPTSTSQFDSIIGTTLSGRWRVLERIGEGGMSVVFKAQSTKLESLVCIKLLRPEVFGDAGSVKRLQNEAKALAVLEHPNILRIVAMEHTGDTCFIVTEFVDGTGLDAILAQSPLSEERARQLFIELAGGLQFAHEHGIVHRDLKPSNVMIEKNNQPKILDFGISKIIDHEVQQKLTKSGTLLGTPAYMAPEQCSAGAIDARTDIYALGCMLYQSLTGKPPFDGESSIEVMMKHCAGTPPALDTTLGRIALKAMSKAPEDRFQTAAEFARALQGEEFQSPPVVRSNSRRRRNTGWIIGALAVMALTSLGGLYYWLAHQSVPPATVEHSQSFGSEQHAYIMEHRFGPDIDEPAYLQAVTELQDTKSDPHILSDACEIHGLIEWNKRNIPQALQNLRKAVRIAHRANFENARATAELAFLEGCVRGDKARAHVILNEGGKFKEVYSDLTGKLLPLQAEALLADNSMDGDAFFQKAVERSLPDSFQRAMWAGRRVEYAARRGQYHWASGLGAEFKGTISAGAPQCIRDEIELALCIDDGIRQNQQALPNELATLVSHQPAGRGPTFYENQTQQQRCQFWITLLKVQRGGFHNVTKEDIDVLKMGRKLACWRDDWQERIEGDYVLDRANAIPRN